jgi:HD-GYP domain-containing protein (c-di-GMP phosphodiesterase class II)
MNEEITRLVSDITVAMSGCSLYSREHPAVAEMALKTVRDMEGLSRDGVLSLTVLADSLVFNDDRAQARSFHVSSLIKRLRRKGIEKAVFRRGVTAEELKDFIEAVTSPDRAPSSSQHISVGVVEVGLRPEGEMDVPAAVRENVSKIQEAYHEASRFKKLDMVGLEEVVASFLSALKREANVLRVISPVKSYSEYTYTHATNVTIVSIFQAERLGIGGETLYEIGLAGLLHDVGKIFVSREVLEKQGGLSEEEWGEIKKHPVLGASYLTTLQGVPSVGVIAAFEHHRKFDGSGYPPRGRFSRRQHLISQIISISDFFDALRTERPYRKAVELPAVLGLIKEGGGKDFNPALVRSFLDSMSGFLEP